MESSQTRRVLIVANRTAATPKLLDRIKEMARDRPSAFSLLIPDTPKGEHTDWTMELALPLLERAAGGPVDALTGEDDPSRPSAGRSPTATTTRSSSLRCPCVSRSGCDATYRGACRAWGYPLRS